MRPSVVIIAVIVTSMIVMVIDTLTMAGGCGYTAVGAQVRRLSESFTSEAFQCETNPTLKPVKLAMTTTTTTTTPTTATTRPTTRTTTSATTSATMSVVLVPPPAEPPALSFVFPCLNEEGTLALCVTAVKKALAPSGISYEIIVADNGSTDRSRDIALELGCRLVPIPVRGYGAALKGGIEAATGSYILFADSDNTYLYEHTASLYLEAVKHQAGMAIASRTTGVIEPGAMPPLHRYLGTPILTWLINRLFNGRLTDCNSGFRCIRKADYLTWDIRSDGMEFASELLIKALKAGTHTVEIASGLRCGPPDRVAHLRTWRDGMRHLLFILSFTPILLPSGK